MVRAKRSKVHKYEPVFVSFQTELHNRLKCGQKTLAVMLFWNAFCIYSTKLTIISNLFEFSLAVSEKMGFRHPTHIGKRKLETSNNNMDANILLPNICDGGFL